jgi:hypothetical protein
MTNSIIEPYAWGYIITLNWMLAWQATNLKVHLLGGWFKLTGNKEKIFTAPDADEYIGMHWGILGELLSCPICLTHWVGAIVSLVFIYFGAPIFLTPLCFFTYPVMVYVVLKILVFK